MKMAGFSEDSIEHYRTLYIPVEAAVFNDSMHEPLSLMLL